MGFKLPVEVLPTSWQLVQSKLRDIDGIAELRMAQQKAGPIVTDQGNLVLDVSFKDGITEPEKLESEINNLPGVLENGLFINLTDEVLVGKIENGSTSVNQLKKS